MRHDFRSVITCIRSAIATVNFHLFYIREAVICFLGVPFNIASYSLLALVLAKVLDLEPGEFIHDYGDVHIYENHIAQFKEQLKRKPRPFPTVKLTGKDKKTFRFYSGQSVLENYDPHPTIKAELTVAGGYYEGKKKKK